MKKILVTGANGYIGQGVIKELERFDVAIIATDINFDVNSDRVKQIATDLFSIDNPYEFFDQPDIILHLAWRDGFKHFSDAHLEDLPKHYQFIRKLVNAGISQVCCLGSMHEIGFFEGCIHEDTPTNPLSLYGISKNALRQSLELLTKDTTTVFQWIRGYYIVGNTKKGCSIFSKITEAEERGDIDFPFTMGGNQFDFIDYNEFCKQIVATILQSSVTGIIDCCSGTPEKLGSRVERFIKENGYNIKLKYGAYQDRPYDSKAVWGSTTKIEKIIRDRG